ncbi:MAG TPA: hypothetical protein PLI05_01785 [Methanotrichaceae archaeon]|nr:hypothetical protein [Methanotrichaceae archaeon]HQF15783.1 hypothetical protein [Methanotrichaceae archaeon]HQI90543.1 hypothetical protein [Methanotrichaceae archaeon]
MHDTYPAALGSSATFIYIHMFVDFLQDSRIPPQRRLPPSRPRSILPLVFDGALGTLKKQKTRSASSAIL